MPSRKTNFPTFFLAFILLSSAVSFAKEAPLLTAVPNLPGAVAWSPDGSQLAVAQDEGLVLIDVDTNNRKTLPFPGPKFISWKPGSAMLVITNDDRLLKVDPETGSFSAVDLPGTPVGARWLLADKTMLVFTATSRQMTIGSPSEIHVFRIGSGPAIEIFRWDYMLPTRNPDVDFTSGWVYPRLNPLDDTLLVPEFHKPPLFGASLRFRAVDPFTGEAVNLFRTEAKQFTTCSSWSPDGKGVALADDEGTLLLWNETDEEPTAYNQPATIGLFPRWNPRYELLYLGGHILEAEGSPKRKVIEDKEAIAWWSPDGKHLALVSQGSLKIVSGIEGPVIKHDPSEIRDKIRILAGLLNDGLITEDDYQTRRTRLLAAKGQ